MHFRLKTYRLVATIFVIFFPFYRCFIEIIVNAVKMFYPSTQNNSSAVENNSPIYLNHVKLTDKEVHAIYTYTHATLTLTGKSSRDTGVYVCVWRAGAWAYKSSRMNLTNQSDKIETQEFKINGEWHMRGTKAEWDEVVLPHHPDIRYSKVTPSSSHTTPYKSRPESKLNKL